MGISKIVADTFRDTSAGAIEGAVGLVDLASQGGAYLYNKATGRNIEPLQYGPMVSDALDLKPDRDSAAYIGGSLVGGALTGGAGAIRSGLQAGAKEGAKAAGTSLAAEAAGYAGSVGAARAAEAAGYGETGQMVAGLAGGMAAGARAPGAGAPVKQDIFGGTGAYNPDSDALREAVRLEKAGRGAASIWNDTGWFRGKDGNWRFEIDDSKAQLAFPTQAGELGTLDEYLNHPELFDQYPELKRLRVKGMTADQVAANPGLGGYYDPRDNHIGINPQREDQKSVFLHEVQHAIQRSEGHSPGGMPETAEGYLNHSIDTRMDLAKPKDYVSRYLQDQDYKKDLQSLYPAERILSMYNVTKPRQVFRSALWNDYEDEVRAMIGPPPKRGKASLSYAQKAGQLIAELETSKLKNSPYLHDQDNWFYIERHLSDGFGREVLDKTRKAIRSIEGKRERNAKRGNLHEVTRLRNEADYLKSFDDYGIYRRLEGEAEAFNVMERMGMSADERRNRFPQFTMGDGRGQPISGSIIPGAPGILRSRETDGGLRLLFDPDE